VISFHITGMDLSITIVTNVKLKSVIIHRKQTSRFPLTFPIQFHAYFQ